MLTRIIRKIRGLIEDLTQTRTDEYTYESSAIFTLLETNPIAVSQVTVNGVALTVNDYSYASGKVTITSSLTANDVIKITYTYYKFISDTDIKLYLDSAFSFISNARIKDFYWDSSNEEIFPLPTPRQENLIALITAILIKPNYKFYKAGEVTIEYPENKSKEEKIRDIIARYKRGSGSLFIG